MFVRIFFGALFIHMTTADVPFTFIHGGDDCQAKYEYHYNLTHLNKPTKVRYTVNLLVRKDSGNPDALLFFFNDLLISEHTSRKKGGNETLLSFPVRVTYHASGSINKILTNPKESDFSYHIKKGIISTLQLPWHTIQDALHDKGPLEFDTNITAKSSTCKINHSVHKMNENEFCVTATRKITNCDNNAKYFQSDYDKYKESKKVWKYHFDSSKSKSLHHVDIKIEDYFKPEENILIDSGFKYNGCDPLDGTWNDSDLQDIYRPFVPPKT